MLAFLIAASVAAQAPKAAEAGPLAALGACRAITDNNARLACYDREVQGLQAAVGRQAVVVVDREEITRTRKSLFGISLPKIPLFKGDSGTEVDSISSTLKAIRELPYDRFIFTLEDGARWETLEDGSRQLTPRVGDKVEVKKGSLGSYRVSVKGRPGLRAQRLP